MLNREQKLAVNNYGSSSVIVAGPGTGKTKVISEKIKYLINCKELSEERILAITFTNKAANELSERVSFITKKSFEAKTFHSFALDLIEKYQKRISKLDKDYILIDESTQLIFFINLIQKLELFSIEIKNNLFQVALEFQKTISRLKDFGVSLENFESLDFEDEKTKVDLYLVYSEYENYKKKKNFLDFSDILIFLKDLLVNNEKIRLEISSSYDEILVDEFQDTNKIQLEIINLIVNKTKSNLTIVGDQKQSIYSFRGANFNNLLEFKKFFPNSKEFILNKNYRSSKKIIECLNKFIPEIINNNEELLVSTSKNEGELNLIECETENSQISYLLERINFILSNNPKSTIGILTRKKSEAKFISQKLKEFNIKHNSNDFENYFNSEIIYFIISVLKIIENKNEANSQFYYLLTQMNIRKETIRKITRKSSLREKSIFKVLSVDKNISDFEGENKIIESFFSRINFLIEFYSTSKNLFNLINKIIVDFKLYQNLLIENDIENISNLNKFLNFTSNYILVYKKNNLIKFLEVIFINKKMNFDDLSEVSNSNIEVLTVHSSKGKEFDFLFLPFLNKGKFPLSFKKSLFQLPFDLTKNEIFLEEKRLFFVAMSRAKFNIDFLYVKRYGQNKNNSKSSEFLEFLEFFNLDKKLYSLENFDFKTTQEDIIKKEIIFKIKNLLLENNFILAKKEIDLLEQLFSKKSRKNNLIKFSNQFNDDFQFYQKRLELNSSFKNMEFVNLDFSKHIYSVSQLKTYEQCPKKYLFQYIYKIPTIAKHYFDFGTSIHTVLEHIVDNLKENISVELEYAKSISLLHKFWISKGYESAKQEREYFEKGLNIIKDFITKEIEIKKNNPTRKIIAKEKTFNFEINGKKIYGIIDRVDSVEGEFEILDYKTSNSQETKTQLNNSIQLFVYAMATKELFGKYPKKLGLWYLLHDKISLIEFNLKNLELVKENILKLIEGIEKQKFNSIPTLFNCKFCDYSDICPDSKFN